MFPVILGLGMLIAVAFIGFAIYGFIMALAKLFAPRGSETTVRKKTPGAPRDVYEDAVAAAHLLNRLLSKNEITTQAYQQARDLLDLKYGVIVKLPRRVQTESAPAAESPEAVRMSDSSPDSPTRTQLIEPNEPLEIVEASVVSAIDTSAVAAADYAPLVPETGSEPLSATQPADPTSAPARAPAKPAPWDMPDPPAPTPRRSMGELMSAFMQDKNIRWGELASGILIVGSAVGLVVSLRNQLNDTIPYFSALMFMLITAAIHGAGNYTLHKWKLRNTSRGALVIGLLLIPINLLAACILTGGDTRRAIDDPMLWIALVVGFGGFGLMSWYSSRSLLRKGYWPLVMSIMGAAIGTLLINRLADGSSLRTALLCLPVVAGFLAGTVLSTGRFVNRDRLSLRGTNRLLAMFGIAMFSAVCAVVLAVVRSVPEMLSGTVAIMPAVSIICLGAIWIGWLIERGNRNSNLITNSNLDSTSKTNDRRTMQVVGLAMQILGVLMSVASLALCVANPTVLVINAAVLTVGYLLLASKTANYKLLPAAWWSLAVTALAVMHLATGSFKLDSSARLKELVSAFVSGESGLCLLAAGAVIAALQVWFSTRITDPQSRSASRRFGMSSAAGVFGLGCVLALTASMLNRTDSFDTLTATVLTGVAALGSVAAGIKIRQLVWLPMAAAGLTLVFLAHAVLWDPTTSSAVASLIDPGAAGQGSGSYVLIVSLLALVLSIGAAAVRLVSRRAVSADTDASSTMLEPTALASRIPTSATPASFALPAAASAALASLGAFFTLVLSPHVTVAFSVVATIAWGLIAISMRTEYERSASSQNDAPATDPFTEVTFSNAAGIFKFAGALTSCVAIAAYAQRLGWPQYTQPAHWLIQITALSVWATLWSLAAAAFKASSGTGKQSALAWLAHEPARADRVVSWSCAGGLAGLTAIGLSFGVAQELLPGFEYSFSLASLLPYAAIAVVAVFVALIVAMFERPRFVDGFWTIVTWMVAFAIGSAAFESSHSIGSALRWLLPVGGLAGAVLISLRHPMIPGWVTARNRLSLSGASTWRSGQSQKLINVWLAIVVSTVLTITTMTVWRVMIHGGASLGGPLKPSWFGNLMIEISYGIPIGIVVGTFLLYAISERRKWLATAGSLVFQYFVILLIVLLFVSPHPALATERFLKILQVVSPGMTLYGFVWWWFRDRINGTERSAAVFATIEPATANGFRALIPDQLQTHTFINGFLITGLATLIGSAYFYSPAKSGGWINNAAGPFGIAALALFGLLAFLVWNKQLRAERNPVSWLWMATWIGLIVVAMTAATTDRILISSEAGATAPWIAYRILMFGSVIVSAIGMSLAGWFSERNSNSNFNLDLNPNLNSPYNAPANSLQALPILLATAIAFIFAARGAMANQPWFAGYETAILCVAVVTLLTGLFLRRGWLSAVATIPIAAGSFLYSAVSPPKFVLNQPGNVIYVFMIATCVAATGWVGFCVYRTRVHHEKLTTRFSLMPSIVVLGGSIVTLLACAAAFTESRSVIGTGLVRPLAMTSFATVFILLIVNWWNDNRRLQIVSRYLWTIAMALLISAFAFTGDTTAIAGQLGMALVVAIAGMFWHRRIAYRQLADHLSVRQPQFAGPPDHEARVERTLKIIAAVFTFLLLPAALFSMLQVEERALRYVIVFVPFALAPGWGLLSNERTRRWLQSVSLGLVTVGVVFLAWADLSPLDADIPLKLCVRTLLAMAGLMLVYGNVVTRWVQQKDTWLTSLKEMSVATCILAFVSLFAVVALEWKHFVPEDGCGLSIPTAVAVIVVVLGMIAGLITIALRPQHDPFAFSLKMRQVYVYAAQAIAVLLVAHIYLSMPWLFKIGIMDYWPYLAMLVSFGGVGIARLLDQRKLDVLAEPLFNTAAVLPILIAVGVFAVSSEAEPSLVLFAAGLIYLMISYVHGSILSGAAAVVFGNVALWLFYGDFISFSILEHPQLFLIPPAISVLIAGQVYKDRLTRGGLAMLRYICVVVIYVSSTSEIFISGIGREMWPAVILAGLSLAGIMLGILLQVRAFLYLGTLFLLTSMIAMVANAHRAIGHVWPWWAFGIGLGVSILVMFGLFEKRRNDLRAIAGKLNEWDL